MKTKSFFAVVPDGESEPAALFAGIEEAIEWGIDKLGADKFSIRGVMKPEPQGAEDPLRDVPTLFAHDSPTN